MQTMLIKQSSILSLILFFMRTKHTEVVYHFIGEKTELRDITTSFVNYSDQLADVFIKSLNHL